jgi:glucose/arabinose dehydrogenase
MTMLRTCLLLLALSTIGLPQGLDAQLVVNGLSQPVDVEVMPGDSTRWLVTEKNGLVRLIKNGVLEAAPFLDVSAQITSIGEGGLLCVALHPNYATNGRFFLHYSDTAGDTAIVEYAVSADPDVALPAAVQTIYSHVRPAFNHFGGALEFGPGGKLFASLGDGGVQTEAQNLSSGLGKLLRLDVDLPPPFIPADNPYVGTPGADGAIWSLGLRNPWRFSFDPSTGDLWVGDVGATTSEEINVWRATDAPGANFGWPCFEGTNCSGQCDCTDPALVPPLHEYATGAVGCAVVGGEVYRGSAMPALDGTYLFADYCSGRFWTLREVGGVLVVRQRSSELAEIAQPVAFGVDPNGELLVLDLPGGSLWRIVPDCGATAYCDAAPNSTGAPAQIKLKGSASIAANDLALRVTSAPPGVPGYFLMARSGDFIPGFGGSQGNLCLGAPILRFATDVVVSGPAGVFKFTPDLTGLPGGATVLAGEEWRFQCWYRDVNPGQTSNTSDGLAVRFCD